MTNNRPDFDWVAIDEIVIGDRHRKDLDIEGIVSSIEKLGLLQPIGIDQERNLVFGERRLRACKALGHRFIPCMIGPRNALKEELAENEDRKAFTPDEIVAIGREIRDQQVQINRARQSLAGKGEKLSDHGPKAHTRDVLSECLPGASYKTFERAEAVVAAAEQNPEKYGGLVEQMRRTNKVTAAYNQLKKSQDEERVLDLAPIEGKFHTLVLDPPWDFPWLSDAAKSATKYATMSLEEIADMPVAAWAMDDFCHLYLWTPNNFIAEACKLVAGWGFEHRTCLTWNKERLSTGHYFRNSTEHVLMATRGKKTTRVNDIPTLFTGQTGVDQHSAKPEEFRDIVERASYPPFGEGFPRQEREGWANLYERIVAEAA